MTIATGAAAGTRTVRSATAWTAFLVVLAVGHHLGSLLSPLGEVGDAQWADWIDLLLPYAVVATAGTALLAVPRGPRIAGAAGLVLYVQGHGIHLAANSIAQRDPGDTAFLWDELVGHAVWFTGLYLVIGALLVGRAVQEGPGPLRLLLSVAVGVTLCSNAIGGHAVPLAVGASSALALLAARRRTGAGVDVLVAAVVALVALAVYGLAGVLLDVSVDHT
ncbi:MAG: hypothetical protein JWN08_197 [Frankiales bacterium]|nr:hypothetical protein [Frankiales bacterium]